MHNRLVAECSGVVQRPFVALVGLLQEIVFQRSRLLKGAHSKTGLAGKKKRKSARDNFFNIPHGCFASGWPAGRPSVRPKTYAAALALETGRRQAGPIALQGLDRADAIQQNADNIHIAAFHRNMQHGLAKLNRKDRNGKQGASTWGQRMERETDHCRRPTSEFFFKDVQTHLVVAEQSGTVSQKHFHGAREAVSCCVHQSRVTALAAPILHLFTLFFNFGFQQILDHGLPAKNGGSMKRRLQLVISTLPKKSRSSNLTDLAEDSSLCNKRRAIQKKIFSVPDCLSHDYTTYKSAPRETSSRAISTLSRRTAVSSGVRLVLDV